MLVGAFESTPRKSDWISIAMALAKTNDARAIPHMIGMIDADGTRGALASRRRLRYAPPASRSPRQRKSDITLGTKTGGRSGGSPTS